MTQLEAAMKRIWLLTLVLLLLRPYPQQPAVFPRDLVQLHFLIPGIVQPAVGIGVRSPQDIPSHGFVDQQILQRVQAMQKHQVAVYVK